MLWSDLVCDCDNYIGKYVSENVWKTKDIKAAKKSCLVVCFRSVLENIPVGKNLSLKWLTKCLK